MFSIVLLSEYIVAFNGYYTERARSNFISAALKDAGVKSWQILPRLNILSTHPSDFDVIKVSTQTLQTKTQIICHL